MIEIGNTASAVRTYLSDRVRTLRTAPIRVDVAADLNESLDEIPVMSETERRTLLTPCNCGAWTRLCYSPTGLPASAPHPERIRRMENVR